MTERTYRRVSLDVFLHCTLGGFADEPDAEPEATIVRMYLAKRPLKEIVHAAEVCEPTIYNVLRRKNIALRTAA